MASLTIAGADALSVTAKIPLLGGLLVAGADQLGNAAVSDDGEDTGAQPALRLGQRDDGAGPFGHARIQSLGNACSSMQRSARLAVGAYS